MLEYLDADNLFVVSLDEERHWYRYHYLFADLLRARLQETRPAQVPELHTRAAIWWEDHGFPVEAVQHALATGDLTLAAATIGRCVERIETWSHVDGATYLDWLRALPRGMLRSRPRLRQFEARALYATGQTVAAEQALQELEQDLQADLDHPRAIEHLLGVEADRASFAVVRGEVEQAIEYAKRSMARLPAGETSFRARLAGILALAALRAGDVVTAERGFRRVIARVCEQGMGFAAVPLVCNLAQVQVLQGLLQQAHDTYQQALQMSTVDGQPTSATGFAYLGLAQVQYEWDDLRLAKQHLSRGLEQLQRARIPASFGSGYVLQAAIQQTLGDPSAAREAMHRAVQLAQASDIARLELSTSAQQARLWLRQAETGLAAQWADAYAQAASAEYLREFEDLTLVRVWLAHEDWDPALQLLDRLLLAAQAADRRGSVIEIQMLRALALAGNRRPAGDSQSALGQALQLAEPEGYVRLFADEGQPMARLLFEVAKSGVAPRYVRRLLAAYDRPGAGGARPRSGGPSQPPSSAALVEPLTAREQEVLQLLAEGRSNAEIAERLFISLPTVKSHTSNLYGKLGVHSRREAVAQAQILGLFPPSE
jgi:LuxR family maltose regulon positive regulatory protein